MPEAPPDGLSWEVATEIYAPTNVVSGDSVMTGPYPRDVIWLWFNDDATQAERQAAVDSIGGEVIGGAAIRPGGVYYVRIEDDGTAGPLHAAIAKLRTLSQVRLATPDLSLVTRPDSGSL